MLQVCDAHIASQLQQLASSQTSGSVLFLEQMNDAWQDHCSQMLTIRSIFLYLDRTYVIADSTVRSIFDMGLQLFRLHLATHPEVHTPLQSAAMYGLCTHMHHKMWSMPNPAAVATAF